MAGVTTGIGSNPSPLRPLTWCSCRTNTRKIRSAGGWSGRKIQGAAQEFVPTLSGAERFSLAPMELAAIAAKQPLAERCPRLKLPTTGLSGAPRAK